MLGKVLGFVLTRRQTYRLVALHALVSRGGAAVPGWAVGEATKIADALMEREVREDMQEQGLPLKDAAEGK